MIKCEQCGGKGKITETRRSIMGTFSTEQECSKCFGKGEIPKEVCSNLGLLYLDPREKQIYRQKHHVGERVETSSGCGYESRVHSNGIGAGLGFKVNIPRTKSQTLDSCFMCMILSSLASTAFD